MRFKRNYIGALRRKKDWIISRFKPLTAHTESIVIDDVWEKVKEEVRKGKVKKWYVMTPENADYFKSEFNINLSKKEISKILKERYKWMIENGQRLELHVHLSVIIDNMDKEMQESLIKKSKEWLENNLNIRIKEFVPGWWSYNEDTLEILRNLDMRLVEEHDYDYIHDYDLILN